jgi:cation transporter protein
MAGSVKNALHSFVFNVLLTYSTVKLVKVPHTYIALIHRILQLIILAYIIGYIVLWKKGYQQIQEPHGTSVIKVKGIAKVNGQNASFYTSDENNYIWDIAEYEIPPIENNAFFIATRQTVTYGQTQGQCPTALDDKLFCNNNTAMTVCKAGQPTPNTFGYFTGNCVPSLEDDTIDVCEMEGWCPEELSASKDYVIDKKDLESFTIFLKTMVTFTLFKKNLRNIQENVNFSCRFDGTVHTEDCPIISLGYILNQLETNRTALLLDGGLIEIRQDWTCNFDRNPKKCVPTYEFSLLQSGDDRQSPGINYRFAQKYRVNGTNYRTLYKVYGLRFVVSITGKGGQFNIVNLFVAIGSGIGFMVIAGIVCDAILMYIHRSREKYRRGKFSVCDVDGTDMVTQIVGHSET